MSENTQNHKNRLLDLEGTFCEKHEKSQNCRIRLTLPGTDKSTFFFAFSGASEIQRANRPRVEAPKSGGIDAYTLGWFAWNSVSHRHTNRLNPFETIKR